MKKTIGFAAKLSFVIVLLLLLFSFAMFQGGFVSWFLFFATLPIFLYHAGLLFYPIKNWHIVRHLSHYVTRAGDRVEVKLHMKRSIPYPLYYCICEEVLPDSLQKVDDFSERHRCLRPSDKLNIPRTIKKIVFPGFRRDIELSYVIDQIPRGEHRLKKVRIRTGDVFGIVTKEHVFDLDDRIVAMPNERPIRMTQSINSYDQGSAASESIHLKNTNIATGIREYMPGDKFSWIDWKQTAKKNTVITKEFEREKNTRTLLVLNACHYQGLNALAFETSVELTMSMLETVQKQTSQAGFLTIGEHTAYIPLHHDPGKKDWIRRHLTRIQPGGVKSFSVKLREEMMQTTSGTNTILVTTYLDHEFPDVIKQVRQRTKNLVVVLIQASALISGEEQNMIRRLRSEGVVMNVVSEDALAKKMIEVTIA
ncbi:hypothetical protein GCM10007063_19810 [Lentibacillus kapialis]|uniref:DUF58 domain-containing protein n=1 Tax=Lentibacillus kapialis TaxID=340214 RepID=A0A917PY05_9BACI|nr:DUF58 domain-containing protein [Lentibacillus kapialis]GGJ97513.1 hypothetical protein GCM10007063_19810 [Lentibacillus kapialis]